MTTIGKGLTMQRFRWLCWTILICLLTVGAIQAQPLLQPDDSIFTRAEALRMMRAASRTLAPVYAPLAEHIVERFDLAGKEGIGIDLGSGPGTLIVELCKRTRLHWINAEINPHFFPYFFQKADKAGMGHRVSAVFADAQALPFRNNYADILVSRGSFHFWGEKILAFSEVRRVLKPGGIAFVGRGFSPNLPPAIAREVRAKQQRMPRYDVEETRSELRHLMSSIGIEDYQIVTPRPPGSEGVNYGIWLEFRKSHRDPVPGRR